MPICFDYALPTNCTYLKLFPNDILDEVVTDSHFHFFSFFFQTYTCDVFFAQSWKDNRLRMPDDNSTSKYRQLPIEWLKEIWRPDSFFKNAKSVTFQTMTIPNHYIWLWKDKTILYMVK